MPSAYIHDIPGRLRVRTDAIKNDERAAAAVRRLLISIPASTMVETNTLTGSITVTYDPDSATAREMIVTLVRHRYLDVRSYLEKPVLENFLERLSRMLLSWTLEHAWSALLALL